MTEREIRAEGERRYPVPHVFPKNINQRKANMAAAGLRNGFIEGAMWMQEQR